jgi:cytochrome c oxidase subunit 2
VPFFQQASNINDKVDDVFLYIFALSLLFLVGLTATMVYFVVRYSRRRNPQATNIEGHTGLEITWTVIPLVLFLSMFYFGWTNFRYMRQAPRDALVVEVTGRQWSWSFKYPNGRVTPELYLALDRPVKLQLVSVDVVHGFFVPAFRVKEDVVPGKVNEVWFVPKLLGSFDVECTVICGVNHSYMLSKVRIVPEAAFKEWYFGPQEAPLPLPTTATTTPVTAVPAEAKPPAVALLEAKGCVACHSLDGSVTVGPTFKGRFGTREVVRCGETEREITIDESYYRRAIQDPQAEIVKGYPPAMPTTPLTEDELRVVVGFLKGLK